MPMMRINITEKTPEGVTMASATLACCIGLIGVIWSPELLWQRLLICAPLVFLLVTNGLLYRNTKKIREEVQHQPVDFPQVNSAKQQTTDKLSHFIERVLPIWSRQIEEGRKQTKDAVESLAQRFAKIVLNLDDVITTAERLRQDISDGEGNMEVLIDSSRNELKGSIQVPQEVTASRSQLLKEIDTLSAYTSELTAMASMIESIAEQTDLLASKATRADEASRDFAVFTDEVQSLSYRLALISKEIGTKSNAASEAIRSALQVAEIVSNQETGAMDNAKQVIEQVMRRFQEITHKFTESSHRIEFGNTQIRDEISEILVSLQFQDRVSQILNAVIEHIDKLHLIAKHKNDHGQIELLDLAKWLEDMEKSYTMIEQRQIHSGKTAKVHTENDDVEYF